MILGASLNIYPHSKLQLVHTDSNRVELDLFMWRIYTYETTANLIDTSTKTMGLLLTLLDINSKFVRRSCQYSTRYNLQPFCYMKCC